MTVCLCRPIWGRVRLDVALAVSHVNYVMLRRLQHLQRERQLEATFWQRMRTLPAASATAQTMSFWAADCTKIQQGLVMRPGEQDGSTSDFGGSSRWNVCASAGAQLVSAQTGLTGGSGFLLGAEQSMDDECEQSVGFSVQHPIK